MRDVKPAPFPMTTSDCQASARLTGGTRHPASQAFHDACDAMKAMHDKKQADYGRANDPFANVRASEDFGIDGWVGAMVRANDKMRRIQKAASGGTLSNEGVEDSLMDLAVYSIIALVLFRELAVGVPSEPMVRWDQIQEDEAR